MANVIVNIFKIPELRKKVLFTLFILVIYRIGAHIPIPGINGQALTEFFQRLSSTQGGALFVIMNMFSGGAMGRATVMALGIMPYISASIIMNFLQPLFPN